MEVRQLPAVFSFFDYVVVGEGDGDAAVFKGMPSETGAFVSPGRNGELFFLKGVQIVVGKFYFCPDNGCLNGGGSCMNSLTCTAKARATQGQTAFPTSRHLEDSPPRNW